MPEKGVTEPPGGPWRGRTGTTVKESGNYMCEDGATWTYRAGDQFRHCPTTGKSTTWERTREPENPD